MFRPCLLIAFAVTALAGGVAPVAAESVRVANRTELVQALRQAGPGSEIIIAPGEYAGGLSQRDLRGSPEQPIVIRAADASKPPVISGGASGLHLSSPQHVELRDLVFIGASGNGLNIDDGGAAGSARGLALKELVVRDVGPDGNRDGIKLSGLDQFRIENCEIRQWGSGGSAIDMVGCHDGNIANCRFLEARGDGANGVQAKGGSARITIQRCRFENAGGRGVNVGGSTGLPYFRPVDAAFEARDITVEDCEFVGGLAAVAFVGVDGAVVQHNTIDRPRRWVLRILQENTDPRFVSCRRGKFVNNLIVFRADELSTVANIGGMTSPETFTFAGNHWHCADRSADTKRLVRLPVPESGGAYGEEPRLAAPEAGDVTRPARQPAAAGVRPPMAAR